MVRGGPTTGLLAVGQQAIVLHRDPVEQEQKCREGGGKRLVLCAHKQETGFQTRETGPEPW